MLHIETPALTIGQLTRHIEANGEPVRRSSHVGNQPPRELAIMAGLPSGVDVLLVDTIKGDDAYTRPYKHVTGDTEELLVSRRKANSRVVGALEAMQTGEKLSKFHADALDRLPLKNRPQPMMKFFAQYPDFVRATMQACAAIGEVRRQVIEDGKIISHDGGVVEHIYKLDDEVGAMLPLNGMIVMDSLVSEEQGSDSTLHLGGADMLRYMSESARFDTISAIRREARALLGKAASSHTYRVLDSRGLAQAVKSRSQHEMLVTKESIDLSPYMQQSTGVTE